MVLTRIMLAVATPAADEAVLMKTAQIARAADAEVDVLHCIFDPNVLRGRNFGSHDVESDIHMITEQRRQQVELSAAKLRAQGLRAQAMVRWDFPAYEGIVRQALRHKPDLIIVQSTSKSRMSRAMLAHTDLSLVEQCPCPLLLIKSARPYADPKILAAVDPMHSRGKSGAVDESILSIGRTVATLLNGALHAYHVAPIREVGFSDAGRRDDHTDEIRACVKALTKRFHVPADCVHIEHGDVTHLLPAFARQLSADIVVMGAVSRSALQEIFLGHTARRVLDTLEQDVLIAKPVGFRSSVAARSLHRMPRSADEGSPDDSADGHLQRTLRTSTDAKDPPKADPALIR